MSSNPSAIERLTTGIPGLDEIVSGGLIRNHAYLLLGDTGTGKTILSLQWLLDGSARGEQGLFVTLVETAADIRRNTLSFGWPIESLDIVDLTPVEEAEGGEGEYHVFPPSEVEREPMWRSILAVVREKRPQRIAIDSVTQLHALSLDEYQFRKELLHLVTFLHEQGCTALLLYEPSHLEGDVSVSLAVDGILHLRREISPACVIETRSIEVAKMRGSGYLSGRHPFRITGEGIEIFPHRVEPPEEEILSGALFSSGIANLDTLLHGGVEAGSVTLLTGPSGVGKSSLAISFLLEGVACGKRALYLTFEEPAPSIVARSRGIGMPIDAALTAGTLEIVHLNPLERYPEEFLEFLRRKVAAGGGEIIAIDSLRGYRLAMEAFGSLEFHLANLTAYGRRMGRTLFLVNEVEQITGDLRLTELGVSYLADNAILLRYAETSGRIIRVIGCLKKRLGDFEADLREFRISPDGLVVGEPLSAFHGLLTGMPRTRGGEA